MKSRFDTSLHEYSFTTVVRFSVTEHGPSSMNSVQHNVFTVPTLGTLRTFEEANQRVTAGTTVQPQRELSESALLNQGTQYESKTQVSGVEAGVRCRTMSWGTRSGKIQNNDSEMCVPVPFLGCVALRKTKKMCVKLGRGRHSQRMSQRQESSHRHPPSQALCSEWLLLWAI